MAAVFGQSMGETALLQSELVGGSTQYDFQHASQRPPPSSYMQRLATRDPYADAGVGGGEVARPMTSNRSAGYSKVEKDPFDPLQAAGASAIPKKLETPPEDKLRELEREVHRLIEDACITRDRGELSLALDKAKEAGKKERLLVRQREQQGLVEQISTDLTYTVCVNLALMHQANGNDAESLSIYTQLLKDKHQNAGRFRVNMGNIYFAQGKFPSAMKMYRMALDQIPAYVQGVRSKIFRNIGHAFFSMRQFVDAVEAYESMIGSDGGALEYMSGFNLILCYYALGDQEKMKAGFERLIAIQQVGLEDEEDGDLDTVGGMESPTSASGLKGAGLDDVAKELLRGADALREDVQKRQREVVRYILNAAQLIGPVVEKDAVSGYEWLAKTLQRHGLPGLAAEVDIIRAAYHLRRKDFDLAIDTLKQFEKRETSLLARAATNLSCLYLLEGRYESAEHYADMAVKADRYNSRALVNKGNCLALAGEFERAKEVYLESIGVSADCLEAIYNLGIVNQHLGRVQEAELAFQKLHSITSHNCEVLWQLGDLAEKQGNLHKALEWFSLIITDPRGRPTDAGVLARIATLFCKQEDEVQAFHYQLESYRFWPVDINVLTWLGIYYVKQELFDSAVPFFNRAADVQPTEAKWKLMVASCYRRLGQYERAAHLYQNIHKVFPQDLECLRYLTQLCQELGWPSEKYALALRKLERQQEAQEMEAGVEATPRDMREFGIDMPQQREAAPGFDAGVPDVVEQKPRKRLQKGRAKEVDDDDLDWGDTELGDDLLPG